MKKENKKVVTIILRVLKIVLLVLGLAAFVGLITHFALGIRDSVSGNDEITAQDRIAGSYQTEWHPCRPRHIDQYVLHPE